MKFSKLTPEMMVRCRTTNEALIVLEELEKQGYKWRSGKLPTAWKPDSRLELEYIGIDPSGVVFCGSVLEYCKNEYIIYNFSDLIIPDTASNLKFQIGDKVRIKSPLHTNIPEMDKYEGTLSVIIGTVSEINRAYLLAGNPFWWNEWLLEPEPIKG